MEQNAKLKPRIVFGVTLDRSVNLMRGLPELMVADGWDVHIVASPGVSLTEHGKIAGVTIHAVPMARGPNPYRDVRSFLQWVTVLRRIRPEVVSIGTPKAGLLGICASYLARVPHRVYHLRGLRLETLKGVPRLLSWALEFVVMKAATEVLAISPSLREVAIQMQLVAPANIKVVASGSSNGVDILRFNSDKRNSLKATFLAEELKLDGELPALGFVGRLNYDKGLDLLLTASEMLYQERIPHQLIIIGSVEDQSLVEQIERHNDSVPVTLIDRVADIAPYYRLMTCLVFPTRREGFGNVSIEAQASGIPVITTNATGAKDTVEHGVSGLIIPKDDALSLVRAIKDLLLNNVTFHPRVVRRSVEKFERSAIQAGLMSYYRRFVRARRCRVTGHNEIA